jgi:ribonuclease E
MREAREPREPREPREGRGPREGEQRRNGRGEGRDTDRPVSLEGTEGLQDPLSTAVAEGGSIPTPVERAPRGRGERRERGERNGEARDRSNGDMPAGALTGETPSADAVPSERGPREERAPRGEGRRERRGGEGTARSNSQTGQTADLPSDGLETSQDAATPPVDPSARRDGDDRRGRTRDRYGRDRRERAPREGDDASVTSLPEADGVEAQAPVALAPVEAPADVTPPARRAEPAARPVAPPIADDAVPLSQGRRPLPKVQPFELPLADLAQVAEGSGLHWVNSDAERVAQVRAAIANEPQPIHVSRERPPAIVIDDGPLVLVETRRNLAATTLPFEREAGDNR